MIKGSRLEHVALAATIVFVGSAIAAAAQPSWDEPIQSCAATACPVPCATRPNAPTAAELARLSLPAAHRAPRTTRPTVTALAGR
jgi:hypothetical protein